MILCLIFLVLCTAAELTQEQQDYLDAHTAVRAGVDPPAKNMQPLAYEVTLEAKAKGYVSNCTTVRPQGDEYGNLGMTTLNVEKENLTESIIMALIAEGSKYNYTPNTCSDGSCTNYKQAVWAETNKCGCATNECSSATGQTEEGATLRPSSKTAFMICFYQPTGNITGERPYKTNSAPTMLSTVTMLISAMFAIHCYV
uniref:SCP domain-containing protein n=1 Tax=Mesocestoides corti TaxID=53468 RepID=A0A5K3FEV4_MESCO